MNLQRETRIVSIVRNAPMNPQREDPNCVSILRNAHMNPQREDSNCVSIVRNAPMNPQREDPNCVPILCKRNVTRCVGAEALSVVVLQVAANSG
jgi:hypothetical protein